MRTVAHSLRVGIAAGTVATAVQTTATFATAAVAVPVPLR